MFCLQCGTQNSPDSNFCKECGGRVNVQKAAASPRRAVERRLAPSIADDLKASEPENPQLQRLLEMAFWHNQTGNVPAAIMACEAALIIDPDSSSALSLLGCLYERQGDIDKAIFAFERVVEINPESDADQEKLAALKRGEYLRPVPQPIRYRWLPPALVTIMRESPVVRVVIPAVCAILFFAVGLAILQPRQSNATVSREDVTPLSNIVEHNAELEGSAGSSPTERGTTRASNSTSYAVIPATSSPIYTDPNPTPRQSSAARDPRRPDTPIYAVPSARRSGDEQIPPLAVAADANPSVPYTNNVQPIQPTRQDLTRGVRVASNGANMPEHTVVVGDGGGASGQNSVADPGQAPDTPTGPPPPASHIMIRVHDDTNSSPLGNANESDSSVSPGVGERGVQLQQKALQLQQSGSYHAAAHIYNQAIAAYKLEIANGTSPDEARRGIAACQTGLQICQQSQ